jgi:Meiotically Up-regulated Gene 113 (MUG113) protein
MNELPKYVSLEPDRHGNVRYYYRRAGRRMRLRSSPETPEFLSEIAAVAPPGAAIEARPKTDLERSMVYFILYGNKRVKIGTSTTVDRRFEQIRQGLPGKAKLHYLTPGDTRLERELHRLFAKDRVAREWFFYSRAIREWIASDKERRQSENGSGTLVVAPSNRDCLTSKISTSNQ